MVISGAPGSRCSRDLRSMCGAGRFLSYLVPEILCQQSIERLYADICFWAYLQGL